MFQRLKRSTLCRHRDRVGIVAFGGLDAQTVVNTGGGLNPTSLGEP